MVTMKDSGIQAIGKIPNSWKIAKFNKFAKVGMGQTILREELTEKGLPIYSATETETIFGYLPFEKINTVLEEGDLVIPARGNSIGSVKYLKSQASSTQTTIWAKIHDNISKRYLYYVSQALRSDWFYFVKTAIPQITTTQVLTNKLPVPPVKKQQFIADFLDEKTSMIDEIIADTKLSIEKLKVYKQSLITETVTRGLDPKVKLVPSGVEWIGDVPEGWGINKIQRLFSITKTIANSNEYDVLSITQQGLKVKDVNNNEGQMAADYSKYQIVKKGYFAMNHMDLLTGGVDYSKFFGVTSPDYRVFKISQTEYVNPYYYLYMFRVLYWNKIFYGEGQGVSHMGRWRLQAEKFNNFYIPTPPIGEQEEIVKFLDVKVSKIDTLIADKELVMTKYESYKKSLIYEYVTGKKQVE